MRSQGIFVPPLLPPRTTTAPGPHRTPSSSPPARHRTGLPSYGTTTVAVPDQADWWLPSNARTR